MDTVNYLLSIMSFHPWEQCMAETEHKPGESYSYCVRQKGHLGCHEEYNGTKFKRTSAGGE